MPPVDGYATLMRSHWIHALKQVRAQNQGREAFDYLCLYSQDGVFCIGGYNAYTARLPFVGTWDCFITVNRIALERHAASLPAIGKVILTWADGFLSVGPTRFPGQCDDTPLDATE